MNSPSLDLIIDGVFAITGQLGVGGMSTVYEAQVDLGRFDYSQLYAYTQVAGDSHRQKLEKSVQMCALMKEMHLDLKTVRKILMLQNIPVPDSVVALKISNENANLERFEAEWKSLICLNHENVIKVYGGGRFENRRYYSMELVRNVVSPETIMKKFSLHDKLSIILQAAEGIRYLHANKIIHRDIKPTNMITSMREDGTFITKITDLGIAKSVASEGLQQRKNTIMGTPNYMSPEQINLKQEIDERGDIYALGACLYKIVSGHRPYYEKGSTKDAIQASLSDEPPTPLNQLCPDIPVPLVGIVNCAMAKDRNDRYQDMGEMIDDLKKVQVGFPLTSTSGRMKTLGGGESGRLKTLMGYHFDKMLEKRRERSREYPNISVTSNTGRHKKIVRARSRRPRREYAASVIMIFMFMVLVFMVTLHVTGIYQSAFLHYFFKQQHSHHTHQAKDAAGGTAGTKVEVDK